MNSSQIANWLTRFKTWAAREPRLLITIGLVTGALWLFVALSDEVLEQEHHEFENQILLSLREPADLGNMIGPPWLQSAAADVSALGGAPVLGLFVLFVLGYLLISRKIGAMIFVVIATVGGTVLNQVLKHYFQRERPDVVPHLTEYGNYSYPSGHSMLSAIVYLTLAVVVAEILPTRSGKIYIIATALTLAFLVGLTRVAVGVHYPSDVLAGWTAGAAWALLCWIAAHWLRRRNKLGDRPLE
ncbi:MAG: phosphatase PAP2 family protein [Chthoniobacterales bacterium]